MKKVFFLMLALTCLIRAEVVLEDEIHIVFPQNISNLDIVSDEEGLLECASYRGTNFDSKSARSFSDYFGFCVEDVCSSVLDSSIFFYESNYCWGFDGYFRSMGMEVAENECLIYDFFVFSDAKHSVMDVIRDEFTHFQKCHYFNISEEKLDSILFDMEQILAPALKQNRHKPAYLTNCENNTGCMMNCQKTGNCLDVISETSIEQILASRNSTDVFPYRMDFTARLRVENGFLVAPAELEGRTFSIFGLDGRVLRRGELRNNMPLPHQPAVLRVEGFGSIYLK